VLKEVIIEEIRKKGYITFDRFVELALYHPEHGYYTSKRVKPVPGEDFFTSPELSDIFGKTVARWIETTSKKFNLPLNILELGGGKGFLSKDIINSLNVDSYTILEKTPISKRISPKVKIVKSLREIEPFEGFVISNEFFDAFPFKRLKKLNGKLYEVIVREKDKILFEDLIPAGDKIYKHFKLIGCELEKGCEYSLFTGYEQFLSELSEKLKKGCFLTFDYGWECKELMNRKRGTLMTFKEHVPDENPYEDIGRKDITSDVDFTYLRKLLEVHFNTVDITHQSKFLLDAGIDKICREDIPAILTLIVEMGRKFKAVKAFKVGKG
jgi:SAM-dependent MidA family methyltransferase